jgi:hypothetical protein
MPQINTIQAVDSQGKGHQKELGSVIIPRILQYCMDLLCSFFLTFDAQVIIACWYALSFYSLANQSQNTEE